MICKFSIYVTFIFHYFVMQSINDLYRVDINITQQLAFYFLFLQAMKSDVLMVTLAFFVGLVAYTDACSCMPTHPQQQFCKSDFGKSRRSACKYLFET